MNEFHWEQGYRSHGYYRGDERLGHIGLPPRPRIRGDVPLFYSWYVHIPHEKAQTGETDKLYKAKRAVARGVAEALGIVKQGKIILGERFQCNRCGRVFYSKNLHPRCPQCRGRDINNTD